MTTTSSPAHSSPLWPSCRLHLWSAEHQGIPFHQAHPDNGARTRIAATGHCHTCLACSSSVCSLRPLLTVHPQMLTCACRDSLVSASPVR
jgi:hypothetical protein